MRPRSTHGLAALVLAFSSGCGGSDDPVVADIARADAADATVPDAGAERESAPACDDTRSPAEDPCVIRDDLAIFVSPVGRDTDAGTQAAPVRTLGRALRVARLAGKRVYACSDTGTYDEWITIAAGTGENAAIYGGFTCVGGWKYSAGSKAKLRPSPSAGTVALSIVGVASGPLIEDFAVEAPDGAAGQSSFAVLVRDSASVVLRRVAIAAGRGGDGQSGVAGVAGADGQDPDKAQNGRDSALIASQMVRGGLWAQASICGSQGGQGGPGDMELDPLSAFGGYGLPITGLDGKGTAANGGLAGQDGGAGAPGKPGTAGTLGPKVGTFSPGGYVCAPAGSPGTAGRTGQGGGGGGGGITAGTAWLPASGGAGGMGGCGGTAGTGGTGGGASVALMSVASHVFLSACDLRGAAGGKGGNGGDGGAFGSGKPGGKGGTAASGPTTAAGNGGKGADGGPGGPGAGGSGGPTFVIVTFGTAEVRADGTTLTVGSGGVPGAGGTAKTATAEIRGPDGETGQAGEQLDVVASDAGDGG